MPLIKNNCKHGAYKVTPRTIRCAFCNVRFVPEMKEKLPNKEIIKIVARCTNCYWSLSLRVDNNPDCLRTGMDFIEDFSKSHEESHFHTVNIDIER